MIPYSRRLMAPQWMLWHVFRYRDGRQQSGNQRGSARDAALNHELSMITTSNITEAAATPTTTTTTMMATTTATIRSVSSVPGMLSANANSEHVAQLRSYSQHQPSSPVERSSSSIPYGRSTAPDRSTIDRLPDVVATGSCYLSIRAFIRSSKHSQLQNPVDNRRSAPVPCRHIFDSIDRSGITVLFSISSKRPSSPSLPSSTGGRGGGGAGLRRRKRKRKSPDKLPRANSVGRGSRRIERTRSIIVPAILVKACLCLGGFFPPRVTITLAKRPNNHSTGMKEEEKSFSLRCR